MAQGKEHLAFSQVMIDQNNLDDTLVARIQTRQHILGANFRMMALQQY